MVAAGVYLVGRTFPLFEHAPDAELEVRMDSKLVVEQMSGRWKIKHPDMQQLALQMRGLHPKDVQFLVSPVKGLGREGGQSVVYLDDARSTELWGALREGRVETYVQRYPDSLLPAGPR